MQFGDRIQHVLCRHCSIALVDVRLRTRHSEVQFPHFLRPITLIVWSPQTHRTRQDLHTNKRSHRTKNFACTHPLIFSLHPNKIKLHLFPQPTVLKHYTTDPKEPPGQGGSFRTYMCYLQSSSSLANHDTVVIFHPNAGKLGLRSLAVLNPYLPETLTYYIKAAILI